MTAAHRLKTPLTLLRVAVGIVKESGATKRDPQEQQLMDRAAQAVDRLEYEINSLLEFLKVRCGAVEMRLESTDVGSLLEGGIAEVQGTVRAKRQTLRVVLEPGLPPVQVDREAIGKVLRSLLRNACQHTPEGGKVTVQVQRTERGVTIQVRDTGPGIPEEERARVFEAYYRGKTAAHPSPDRGLVSTGLGLAIAKPLVEMHGGSIWVQDHPGQGAWFAFSLPVAEEKGRPQPPP